MRLDGGHQVQRQHDNGATWVRDGGEQNGGYVGGQLGATLTLRAQEMEEDGGCGGGQLDATTVL